ncbi:unnamed protein product [Ostreobium quekettii]|uniref:Uncharacterized protein n=1 Tax=Ostreobium quekettii TaxID=121088 RepID=A0A8S1JEY1_9CHLO|nr:unnamed protein product [Ostreobium quekettii]
MGGWVLGVPGSRLAPDCRGMGSRRCAAPVDLRCTASGGGCVEDDPRYRRIDFSREMAHNVRVELARNLALGEARMDVALAALQIAAEDDAIVSLSSVPFPIQSFLARIERLASDVGARLKGQHGSTPVPVDITLPLMEKIFYAEQRFKVPPFLRSNIPDRSIVAHPGVWENAAYAYLHELLIRRVGIPATVAILYHDVMRRLLLEGVVDFVIGMDMREFSDIPQPKIMPGLTRELVVRDNGTVLNTCNPDALREMLRYLKRSFWPFAWDASLGADGGFRSALSAALNPGADAHLEIISRAAKHRLDRGISTSPGAGDIRRALAASERLVMLCHGDQQERRDLAILLYHCGEMSRAMVELSAYCGTGAFEDETSTDKTALKQLLSRLKSHSITGERAQLTTIENVLAMPPPQFDASQRVPLSW